MAVPAYTMAQAQPKVAPAEKVAPAPTCESSGEIKAVTQAILEEIDKRSELMANIEYLCDMIGPRLTGSPNLTRANQWTRDKFQQYGLANPHLESWKIERAWTRGDARGRVVVPVEQRILLESAGWSPSTKGLQRGPVVHVKAQSADELVLTKASSREPGFSCPRSRFSLRPSSLRLTWTGRCGGGCAITLDCGNFGRPSRSSWSRKGPPAFCVIRTRSTAWST